MYNFFIDGVQFPVAPSKMTTRINNKNEVITLMNEGEVNILKKPGLTDIEFEVLLPNVKYPFAVYPGGFQPSTFYLEHLENKKIELKPFPFIVNRMMPNGNLLFDTNMLVSLEDYEIQEDAENGFDIVVTVNLKQYREYGNKKLIIKTTPASNSTSTKVTKKATVEKKRSTTTKSSTPKTHKVVSGDTLWSICKRYYGTSSKSMTDELAAKNGIKNPNLIRLGQVIKL